MHGRRQSNSYSTLPERRLTPFMPDVRISQQPFYLKTSACPQQCRRLINQHLCLRGVVAARGQARSSGFGDAPSSHSPKRAS